MAVVTTPTSVPTGSAVQILGTAPYSPNATVVVSNLDATNPVFIGGPGVTATTGVRLAANTNLVLTHQPDPGGMYAIATGGTVNVVVGVF